MMNEMNEQNEQNERFDPMSEQPHEGLTTQDIVSGSRRKDVDPDTGQPIVERSARLQPAGAMAPDAPDAREAARDQPPQRMGADAAAPTSRERLSERDASAYAGGAGTEAGRAGAAPTRAAGRPGQVETAPMSLLSDDAADAFHARWDAIQTGFVDEPRRVVEQADSLVAEVMRQLAETFAQERAGLERQWARGGDVSTEDLRLALQRYRSFFQRLLSA